MPSRAYLQKPIRTPCIGDLRDQVRLLRRAIQPPLGSATDFEEAFTEVAKPWADIRTTQGVAFFDGVSGVDIPVTHVIYLRLRSDIDTETWVELPSGTRLRVLRAEDPEELGNWLKLTCTERGPDNLRSARA